MKPQPGVTVTKAEVGQPFALRSPIAQLLNKDAARALIEPMLRPGESFDRVIVEMYHLVKKNPDVLKCEPASIVTAVARAVSTGLTIGETVHLVPFGKKLECVSDYKGLIELVCRSGAARSIDAHCVYENEEFVVEQGTAPQIRHVPIMDPATRGELVGAYAVAWVNAYRFLSVVLHEKEIDAIRQKYSKQWKGGDVPYWYAQKTCVRRLVKLLPKNPELAKVLATLDREDEAERAAEEVVSGGVVAPGEPLTSVSQTPNGEEEPIWLRGDGIDEDEDFNDFGNR